MKRFSTGFLLAVTLLLSVALFAQNQGFVVPGSTLVQQSAIKQDAASFIFNTESAVNTQTTTTITAGPNQYIYITYLHITVCTNGTGTAQNQVQFTTTNIPNTPAFQYSIAATASICQTVFSNQVNWKSTIPGTAVTIVPPSAAANNSYQVLVSGYYGTM